MLNYINPVLRQSDIFFLQELHGTEEGLTWLLRDLRKSFDIWFSVIPGRSAGGICIGLRKECFAGALIHEPVVVAPGRIMHMHIVGEDYEFFLANVHNFELKLPQVHRLQRFIAGAQLDDRLIHRAPIVTPIAVLFVYVVFLRVK